MILLKKFAVICSAILFSCVLAFADEEIHEFEVQGEGSSYKDALQDALVNGISQQYGFILKSEEVRQTKVRELSAYVNDQVESMGEIDISSQGRIDFKTEGFVQNYKVLSKTINSSDLHEVTVFIKIARYKTPGISPDSRRKIAVIPFWTTKPSFVFQGELVPSSLVTRLFAQKMVAELTQSRKFTVLDREYIEEFLREKNLLLTSDTPVSELMKLGEVLGVDYLFIGTISEAGQKQAPYRIQVTGESGYNYSASFIADYRIVVMATRQIKWADSVALSLGNAEIKNMMANSIDDQIQRLLLSKAAKQIVQKAMSNIYPLRVVAVQDNGDIVLNQGGITISDGDILDVFRLGEIGIDPYNAESLGATESWVATIKISRVIPKMSFGIVIKGELASIQEGSICRRVMAKSTLVPRKSLGRTTNVQPTPSGGVRLPFD